MELDLATLALPDEPELEKLLQELSVAGADPLKPAFLANGGAEAEA